MPANGKTPIGPAIHAVDLWAPRKPPKGIRNQLFDEEDRARLARIASIVRFRKGDHIYDAGDPAEAVFNIINGVVTSYASAPGDREHISAFLYAGDIFGLPKAGHYANSARATTAVTAYRLPVAALRRVLSKNADLDFEVIVKLCEELRQAQRHSLLLAQKHAVTKLAMFLDLQEHLQSEKGESVPEIYLPMDRSAIAEYVGLSLAAVSRAFRALITHRVVSSRDRRHVRIADRRVFDKLVEGGGRLAPAS